MAKAGKAEKECKVTIGTGRLSTLSTELWIGDTQELKLKVINAGEETIKISTNKVGNTMFLSVLTHITKVLTYLTAWC